MGLGFADKMNLQICNYNNSSPKRLLAFELRAVSHPFEDYGEKLKTKILFMDRREMSDVSSTMKVQ